ncbi:MAG: thermonuclease family protein [Leptolyngbyaceae cyanobacterium SL_1_1]|nr:thermonuclease family protein [Leptolyngbyaceae cyanobacterium RM1_1_2]NJO08397.1 thermonuclease family protein [Leptolyngbyaceae cyanobacterium SL_1_1]
MTQRLKFQLKQIKDGDTLVGNDCDRIELIRLYGIDCPELAQRPYGDKARQRLQQLLQPYEEIEIIEIDRDRHDRLIGEVWVVDGCINTQMLSEGHAVAYRKHLHDEFKLRYLASEAIARRGKLNFWRQVRPEMPWEYRYRHPR